MDVLKSLFRGIDELIFPPQCLACDLSIPSNAKQNESICELCHSLILNDTHEKCPRCASTIGPHIDTSEGCPTCRKESFTFESVIRIGPYADALKSAVLKMKHLDGESLAEAMGRIWAIHALPQFQKINPQIVIPIPLHWRRKWERGYNQSEGLANGIAAILGLRSRASWLKRVRYWPINPDRSRTERLEIVKGAFRVSRTAKFQNMRVLLVDDVLTTGATVNEAAKVIKAAGAAQVTIAIAAHR